MTRFVLVAGCLGLLVGCEFARMDEMPVPQTNSCSMDRECGSDAMCMNGLCVASSADRPIEVALQVTPLPNKESDSPRPALIERLLVKGPLARPITLPALVDVSGRLRSEGVTIDAAVSFIPEHSLSGIPPSSVAVTSTPGTSNSPVDFSVQLSEGVSYRMLVRPTDTSLPPYHTRFEAVAGQILDIDFAGLGSRRETFVVGGAGERPLLLRAYDQVTGEPVSSSARIENGRATLSFASDAAPYRLEIRAEQSYDTTAATKAEGNFCDDDTPVFPVYSVLEEDLGEPTDDGEIEIELPEPPSRIRYEGTIAMCDDALREAPVLELPVSLHSRDLLPEGSAFRASIDAKTTAKLDPTTGELAFCVQVIEGVYDVVVTPPTSTACSLYAQRLPIEAPDDKAMTGVLLQLPKSASLHGMLQTAGGLPLEGATVEAVALGHVDVSEEDMTLTRYNRSRQASSGADGSFDLPVDLGGYDVLIKPPPNSGFSWQVRHDVVVGARREFSSMFDMSSPVPFSGKLAYEGGGDEEANPLGGAEVLAFAVIDDGQGGERAVPIGKTMAGSDGAFVLLLPQAIKPEW